MSDDNIDIEICSDCAMMSANGTYGWEYDEKWLANYVKAVEVNGEPVLVCDDDCDGGFSWSPCGFCGSTLGGDRHHAVIMAR